MIVHLFFSRVPRVRHYSNSRFRNRVSGFHDIVFIVIFIIISLDPVTPVDFTFAILIASALVSVLG